MTTKVASRADILKLIRDVEKSPPSREKELALARLRAIVRSLD